ncbi:hypothetical protein CIG19_09050 [Enterobacterales bacterium CwR94]|nr:hypothetical protein CIG19_09050 [Enterobacterales bacterium CwR94]
MFSYSRLSLYSLLVFTSLLSGCQAPANSPLQCVAGERQQQTTLYFGLNRPEGAAITQSEWQQFVDQEVTPRFRDGLTVVNADGQWLGNNGDVVREKSKTLMLIYAQDNAHQQAIEAIRHAYKVRFAQESVMRVDLPICVDF